MKTTDLDLKRAADVKAREEAFTPQQNAYQRAAEIANTLLMQGVPVLRFGAGPDGKISVEFELTDVPARYVARLAPAEATPERFRELYEAVA